ncbi:MAG: biotin--[acetyl-CoA-carboxylase] ligase [Phycisphaerae bacterium]
MHRPITVDDLRSGGRLARLGSRCLLFPQIDSTNGYLLSRSAELEDGTIAFAELQTAGRGRLGRRWLAPRGSSILLSVLLRERRDSPLVARDTGAPLASLAAAVAACEAIESCCRCSPMLRWPNDVVVGGRKLGGVLAESTPLGSHGDMRALVIGIGINCLQHAGHFDASLAESATSLEIECSHAVDRAALTGALVVRLDERLASSQVACDALQAWRQRCDDVGRGVTLDHDGHRYTGTVVEIDDHGDLVVELLNGGRRCFASATTARSW